MNTPAISIALILPPEFHDAIPADPIFLCSNQFETIEYHINRSSNLNSSIFTSSRLTQTQIKSKKRQKETRQYSKIETQMEEKLQETQSTVYPHTCTLPLHDLCDCVPFDNYFLERTPTYAASR